MYCVLLKDSTLQYIQKLRRMVFKFQRKYKGKKRVHVIAWKIEHIEGHHVQSRKNILDDFENIE